MSGPAPRPPGTLGQSAEALARRFLEARGCRTLAANYRCPMGEIDLVVEDGKTLVYVEVRYRRSAAYGGGLESVDAHKQRRLIRAALHFQQHHRGVGRRAQRFDVVAISPGSPGAQVDWVRDAFQAE